MTQEDKELLLVDLSARLPCGVEVYYSETVPISTVKTINSEKGTCIVYDHSQWYRHSKFHIEEIKPYLRPRSSMTDKEREELRQEQIKDEQLFADCIINHPEMRGLTIPHFAADWCNKNYFDYRGLIEKNLAIAVTEENNPYKD